MTNISMNKDFKNIVVIEVVNNIVTSDRTINSFIVITVFIISGAISDVHRFQYIM
jgi:hypothetical protein